MSEVEATGRELPVDMQIAILRDAVMVLGYLGGVVVIAEILRPVIEAHPERLLHLIPVLMGLAVPLLILFMLERVLGVPRRAQLQLRLARRVPPLLRPRLRRCTGRKRIMPIGYFYLCHPRLAVFSGVMVGLLGFGLAWLRFWAERGEIVGVNDGISLWFILALMLVYIGLGFAITGLWRHGILRELKRPHGPRANSSGVTVAQSASWTGRAG
jgi:hypothetical protein